MYKQLEPVESISVHAAQGAHVKPAAGDQTQFLTHDAHCHAASHGSPTSRAGTHWPTVVSQT
jgi:hypothetical protein